MRGLIKRYQRVRINRRIAENRDLITAHRSADPDAFEDREQLYMHHYDLLEQREAIT